MDPLSPTLPCGREEIGGEAGVSEGPPFLDPLYYSPTWGWLENSGEYE